MPIVIANSLRPLAALAFNIRAARGAVGCSRAHLADVAGVSVNTVERAEDASRIGGVSLAMLAAILGGLRREGATIAGTDWLAE